MASYSKTSWIGNELITAADLNRIENGIDDAITAVNNLNDNKVSTSATIALDHGGTGATSASAARQNLKASAYLSFTDDDTTWSAIYTKITDNIPTGGSATFWSSQSATQIITKNSDLNFSMRGVISRRYADNFDFLAAASASPSFLISIHITDAGQSSYTIGDQGIMIFRGGTPANYDAQPKMLINLESGSESNVLVSSPRPGVTGVLPIAHGGTGANTAIQGLKNLGGMAYVHLNLNSGTLDDICGSITDKIIPSSAGAFWGSTTVANILTNGEITTTLKGTIIVPNATHIDIFAFTGDDTHTHKVVTINIGGTENDNIITWSIQKVAVFYTNPVLELTATTASGLYDQLITLPSGQSINVDFKTSDAIKVLTNNKIESGVVSGQVRRNSSGDDIVFDFFVVGAGDTEYCYRWRDTFTTAKALTVGKVYKYQGTEMS